MTEQQIANITALLETLGVSAELIGSVWQEYQNEPGAKCPRTTQAIAWALASVAPDAK